MSAHHVFDVVTGGTDHTSKPTQPHPAVMLVRDETDLKLLPEWAVKHYFSARWRSEGRREGSRDAKKGEVGKGQMVQLSRGVQEEEGIEVKRRKQREGLAMGV